jgi:Xaa-Pro dipeptidase
LTKNPRLDALIEAEKRADGLLAAIEDKGLIAPGRTERDVEQDIYALAERDFGVLKHWHKRIVRSGPNTVCVFAEDPPILQIGHDDTVFLDLGPVFDEWEADVGRTYVLGDDPEKHRLCSDLPRIFDLIKQHFNGNPDVTGAELYAFAQGCADAAGWVFGGAIAGHIVGEFPHARLPGQKEHYRINPDNTQRMRDPDGLGQEKHWIIEVHLVDHARTFGGFYERLLVPAG